MDAMTLAGQLNTSHMHNVIAGTTGGANDVRVWLRNGYGILIKRSQSSVLCIMPVRFTEPFDPDWTEEPKFEFIRRATGYGIKFTDPGHPSNHVQGVDVHGAIAVLSRLYELDRAQSLKTH